MGWNIFSTICGLPQDPFTGDHYPALLVIKRPVVWKLADIITSNLADHLDGHFRTGKLADYVSRQVRQREEVFQINVPDETMARYAVWRGWLFWDFDDEDDEEEYV